MCHMHYARFKRNGSAQLQERVTYSVCTVDGCSGKPRHNGLCGSHYRKNLRYGDPLAGKTQRGAILRWIDKHKEFDGDECLIWPFARNAAGYAVATLNGVSSGAYRHICLLAHGEPPSDQHHAAHTCGNGLGGCVNPKHLRWATPSENNQDKFVHGTIKLGQDHPMAKLSENDVLKIRASSKTGRALARDYGVTPSEISAIRRQRVWTHI